jgi:hypothetical protein
MVHAKIQFTFPHEILKDSNIRQIVLESSQQENLTNGSHLIYKGEIHSPSHQYKFIGFHQDGFLVITLDVHHKNLGTIIESKDVYVIPIDWKYVQIPNSGLSVWAIDVQQEVFTKMFYLNIRKRLQDIPCIKDFIENHEYKEVGVKLKRVDIETTKDVLFNYFIHKFKIFSF